MADPENLRWMLCAFAFVFGALWGSFLNVVIYRLPAGLSVVKPASRCPGCETPIRAWDNIPVLSWLLLRGKCRDCGTSISIRYPAIELTVAVLALLLALHVFTDARVLAVANGREELATLLTPWFFLFAWVCALVALFWIDLDVTELPPEITIPAIAVGLLYSWMVPEIGFFAELVPNVTLLDAGIGALVGGGLILALILGYYLLTGRIGLGFGDVWMMAMVGAFVGWQGLFFVYLASSLQGILVAALAVGWAKARGEDPSALFRNDEVAEIERELEAARRKTEAQAEGSDSGAAADARHDSGPGDAANADADPDPAAADAGADDETGDQNDIPETEEDPAFGKLAVPFGPFIAVSAVEFIFIGEPVLELLMGPAGYALLYNY